MSGKYDEELARLCSYTHGRNAQLLRLALLGRRAGRSEAEIMQDLIQAGGEPRLTDQEVERAVKKAFNANFAKFSGAIPFSLGSVPTKNKWPVPKNKGSVPNRAGAVPSEKQRNFVRRMIEEGGGRCSSEALMALSKGGNFFDKVLDEGKLYFFGDPYTKRTRNHLYTREQVKAMGDNLPTHFIPNPFTGNPGKNEDGKDSWCIKSTLAEKTLALIEFDNLELELQAAFWRGVIKTKALGVLSLVYSGGKSIHGLILLEPTDWEGQWRRIERLMASDPDKNFRCDISCKDGVRMTRVPGALRADKHRRQTLLYLA